MENKKTYTIKGWSPLSRKYFLPIGFQTELNTTIFDMKVTDASKIKVYLDPRRCHSKESKKYHKEYTSKKGFNVYQIFELIVKTYWDAVDDIYDGDEDHISNLALHTFTFDSTTNSVYPSTDS